MIFVDSWAWIALADRHDQSHAMAAKQYADLRAEQQRLVTTDYVLSEVITRLSTQITPEVTLRFVEAILKSGRENRASLEQVGPIRFQSAMTLRRRFSDKPRISFVDLTSMAVMAEMKITDIFTGDSHFTHVGMGFRLLPETP